MVYRTKYKRTNTHKKKKIEGTMWPFIQKESFLQHLKLLIDSQIPLKKQREQDWNKIWALSIEVFTQICGFMLTNHGIPMTSQYFIHHNLVTLKQCFIRRLDICSHIMDSSQMQNCITILKNLLHQKLSLIKNSNFISPQCSHQNGYVINLNLYAGPFD